MLACGAAVVTLLTTLAVLAESGFETGASAYRRGDYDNAFPIFRRLAEQGDPRAQTVLGLMYSYGEGVAVDHQEATRWYGRAADQGYSVAQYNLAMQFANGEGHALDKRQAIKWLALAAAAGHDRARNKLAELNAGAHAGSLPAKVDSVRLQPSMSATDGSDSGVSVFESVASGRAARRPAAAGARAPLRSTTSESEVRPGARTSAIAANAEAHLRQSPNKSGAAYRVQLAASRSEANMRRDWLRYRKQHAKLFAELDGAVERAAVGAENTVWYRLRIGPFPSKAEALSLCKKLRDKRVKTGCLLLRVGG